MAEALYPKFIVYVIALDEVSPEWVDFTIRLVKHAFDCAAKMLDLKLSLPAEAYSKEQSAYNLRKSLALLRSIIPEDGSRIIGLTMEPLFNPKNNAAVAGGGGNLPPFANAAIIRISAAMRGIPAESKPEHLDVFLMRIRKLLLHELGHTFFTEEYHCLNPDCLMRAGSKTLGAVDTLGSEYCGECAKAIRTQFYIENQFIECLGEPPATYLKHDKRGGK